MNKLLTCFRSVFYIPVLEYPQHCTFCMSVTHLHPTENHSYTHTGQDLTTSTGNTGL